MRESDGEIFGWNQILEKEAGFVECDFDPKTGESSVLEMALEEVGNDVSGAIVKVPDTDRMDKIVSAVSTIPLEKYGAAIGGRTAQPKVADVSEAAGFPVKAVEIAEALKLIAGQ
jgi:hypothetical protein